MKNLFYLMVVSLMIFASCVDDEEYEPPTAETGDVVLNEIMSKDPVTDLDWIELYNKSDVEVDISGFLVNDKTTPDGGYEIPAGTKIAANGFFVLNEGEDFTFGISSGGEDVSLGDADGKLIDQVFCPASQQDGTSFSRVPDGGDIWLNGTEATPDAPNVGDASIPSISIDYNEFPTAEETVEVEVEFTTTETVNEVAVYYATGDNPVFNADNKITGTIDANIAVVTMTDLNVVDELVSFFVAVALDNGETYYYDKNNAVTEFDIIKDDASLWNTYTTISGSVPAPTLALTFSETPTEGYEAVELEYSAEIEITEARIYFAAGDNPEYIKANKVKGEDDASFTQTGVTISMANVDVEDANGDIVGTTSDPGVMISFYVRIQLANGTEYYYDKEGNVIVDDEANGGDPTDADNFKDDPTRWNTYTNKPAATLSTFDFPSNPTSTDDINVVLEYASDEEIEEVRIYFAHSDYLQYVKANKIKGEDDASFTQTGVTINMANTDVEDENGDVIGTTSDPGATISFYVRIGTATSEYYYVTDGTEISMLAVDDSPADGAYDSSDAFKDDPTLWVTYTVQE